MSSRLARTSSIAALVAGTVALVAPSAASAATSPSNAGAAFLAAQLKSGGDQITTNYGGTNYPDQGLSADSILALESLHVAGSETAAANSVFASSAASYISYGDDLYAGALAKTLIVAKASGANAASFAGHDLVAGLKGLEAADGRFDDKSSYGNNANNFGQSLAIIGLAKAGSPTDTKAVSFLLSQQCADGGFKLFPDSTGCSSDPDTTALAVQALTAAGGNKASVARAMTFLSGRQGADGGVTGGTNTEVENSNSTGLAAVAFAMTGDAARASKARAFVNSLQYGCTAPESLRGAIAWSKGDMATVATSKKPVGNETRATAQALLAFSQQPYLATSSAGASAATPVLDCSTGATTKPTTPVTTKPSAPASTKPTTPVTTKPATSAPKPPVSTSVPATSATKPASSTSAPVSSATKPATSTSATKPTTTSTPASSSAVSTAQPTAGVTTPASTPAAPAGTTTSKPATGPVVNTDKVDDSSSLAMETGLAAVALIAAGGTVAFARRR